MVASYCGWIRILSGLKTDATAVPLIQAMDLVWTPDSQHVLVCGAGSSSYLEVRALSRTYLTSGFASQCRKIDRILVVRQLHRVNFKPESKTVTERLWSSVPHTSTASTLKIDAKQR